MGMHAEGPRPVVFEDHLDRIPDPSAQYGAKEAKILLLREPGLQLRERFIGILAVNRLFVDSANPVRTGFHIILLEIIEGMVHGIVAPVRRIVPGNFIGGNVIGTNLWSSA